jgi:DNA-binding LacI/PurR family transcriptional regulator/signal transduction histidine kinase/ActR/RegA family two-component response regulator
MIRKRPSIAFLMDHFLGEYQAIVRTAVETAAREQDVDFFCIVGRALDSPFGYEMIQNEIFSDITQRSVSGVIIAGGTLSVYSGTGRVAALCRRLAPLPVCCIGLEIEGVPSIVLDNRRIDTIVEHLVERHQCRDFAFIGGPTANEEAVLRRAGFLEALRKFEIPFDEALEADGLFTIGSGQEAAERILSTNKRFDALVAANDNMALGATSVLKKHGLHIPEDVCVTGFDDIPSARFGSPRLSTMRQPLETIGRQAVSSVLEQVKGGAVPLISKISPILVARNSCGCDPGHFAPSSKTGGPPLGTVAPRETSPTDRDALEALILRSVSIPEEAYERWARRAADALVEEVQGRQGCFVGVLESILPATERRMWLIDELHLAISRLRRRLLHTRCADGVDLEIVWHDARVAISDAVAYAHMKNQVAADLTAGLFLRRASADLPSALTRDALVQSIARELETIGIENGWVSVFPEDNKRELECIVAIRDGQPALPEQARYASETVVPGFCERERRMSYMVSPLSIGTERLGVMVLELGAADLYYEILREHMSSFLKSIAIHRNLVTQLKAEADKKQRELTMQHRQKLESLGVLAGGIAHDFNNMLSAMAANLDAMLIDLTPVAVNKDPLLECKAVVTHASGLCRQLLAYSGKGNFFVRKVNLNQIITDLEDLLRMSVSKDVRLTFDLEAGLPDVEADVSQITQVFVNLVINASEAMGPSGGEVMVQTALRFVSKDYFKGSAVGTNLPAGEYVTATVSDTGEGISKEILRQIFDPFFTTKFTGRGLGLAAVLGIVRGHSGAIKVSSQEGQGTVFEILFPMPLQPRSTSSGNSVMPPWTSQGTVLLVDDEPVVLRSGARLLKRMGFSVLKARDGQESIDIFNQTEEAITCVILDLTMPGMGGLATMAELKKARPDVPIILSSGYSEEQIAKAPKHLLPAAFLPKPYDFDTLSRTLRKVLSARDKRDSKMP